MTKSSVFCQSFARSGIMSSPSSNNAWLMKIELKREEPVEINKDDRIKKAVKQKKKTSFNLIIIFLPQLRLKLSR